MPVDHEMLPQFTRLFVRTRLAIFIWGVLREFRVITPTLSQRSSACVTNFKLEWPSFIRGLDVIMRVNTWIFYSVKYFFAGVGLMRGDKLGKVGERLHKVSKNYPSFNFSCVKIFLRKNLI